MASISVSGIGSAGRTVAWARSPMLLALAALGIGAAPSATLDVTVAGLRSAKGDLRACLTVRPDRFPDCQQDPAARHLSVPATSPRLLFDDLPAGDYALALIHDENDNARLDTFAGVPREGVGFTRNPRLLFGPPRFAAASLKLDSGRDSETVKVRYFL